MTWADQFPELNRPTTPPKTPSGAATGVQSLRDIPPEATPQEVFRIPIKVMRIDERETQKGDPCYFLNVQDSADIKFSVVCWDWQWAAIRDGVVPGQPTTLDVRVPEGNFRSFRLALPSPRKGRRGG